MAQIINNFLDDSQYDHKVIVHENWFGIRPDTTNNVEFLWSYLKSIGNFDLG